MAVTLVDTALCSALLQWRRQIVANKTQYMLINQKNSITPPPLTRGPQWVGMGFLMSIVIPCTTSHFHPHSQRCSFLFSFPSIFESDSRSLPRKFPHLIQNSNDSPNRLESWHDTHTRNSSVSPEDVPAYEKKNFLRQGCWNWDIHRPKDRQTGDWKYIPRGL